MNELADRGLDSLLDRYFDTHHTPEAEQRAVKSMQALRDLTDPAKKLSQSERERRVKQVVEGLSTTLPNLKDPFRVMHDANVLLEVGVTRDANLLEYWGENPATQSRLRPVAEAVYRMLGQAADDAQKQADALQAKITAANQGTVGVKWDQLDNLTRTAKYRQNMMAYFIALSLPKGERAKLVDQTLTYLKDLDSPDTQVQPLVRVMEGKLQLVKGDFEEAAKTFQSVYDDKKKEIQPVPGADQQYQARYFANIAALEEGHVEEAKKGLEELVAWQKQNLPPDKPTQDGVAAAAEMLRYRIDLAEAALASDPAAKKNAETAATNILLKLSADRPDLRGIIYQQLVERLPKDAPVAGMDPLLLQGLMAKALGEANKPQGTQADKQALQRGLDAAAEMLRRPNAPTITPQQRDEAARLTPVLLEALEKKTEAANVYLEYAQKNATVHPQAAQGALEDAGRLTFELRRTSPDDPAVSDLYDRFLPIAINPPFNKTTLAFYYAQRLRLEGKPQDAVKFFRMVANNDRNYASAQYYLMQAEQDLLDNPKLPDSSRAVLAGDVVRQAQQVRQLYGNSNDPAARERAAIATLAEAKVAGAQQKRPEQTLQLLNGFEQAVQGTPDEKVLVGDALLTRVNAYMSSGQLKQATDALVALLNHSGGAQGAEYVRGLLERLDKDLDRAEAANNVKAMQDISRSEANLSGFLVNWARNNQNAEIRKFTYQYMVFDARTKRLAGTLAQDPQERTKLLNEAMEAYKRLQEPQNVALYKGTLDPKRIASGDIDPNHPDPNVQLGVALTDYELKDYKDASTMLGDLLNNGKLGGPTIAVQDASGNDQKITENDLYWDATYKLYRSNVALAANVSDASLNGTKQGLKNLLIRGGIPAKWQDRFDDLRKDIIPEFNLASLTPATTQSVSTRVP